MATIIPTHDDNIWTETNCQDKEDAIKQKLTEAAGDRAIVQIIDSITTSDEPITQEKLIVTDNHFNLPQGNILQLGPELWSIYALPAEIPVLDDPKHRLNCLINRMSSDRMIMLYKLHERGLVDNNLVSFNCYTVGNESRPLDTRSLDYSNFHIDQQLSSCWNPVNQELLPRMPLTLPDNMLPNRAAELSEITIVCETYVHSNVIAFSEKIFRALQTPRPWAMLNSPNAVSVLRKYGFDVLDDIVNHCSYDDTELMERRIDKILNAVTNINVWGEIDHNRLHEAATHNRLLLAKYAEQWPNKLEKILAAFS